jgi:hypothetical protein
MTLWIFHVWYSTDGVNGVKFGTKISIIME